VVSRASRQSERERRDRAGRAGADHGALGERAAELEENGEALAREVASARAWRVEAAAYGRRSPNARFTYCRGPMARIPINISELVGGTPLVALPRMLEGTPAAENGVELFAKLESFNPGGSVKDRIGVAMIEAAEAEGRIEPGRTTIVEATSGNTGIALAFVCAAKGYELVLTLPQGMSRERESLLRLYGARVEVTESLGGMSEAVAAAQAMARDEDVFLPDQFTNPANPQAHREHTGPEIERALDGRIDVLVAGVGTGGTITGVGEYLRDRNEQLRVVAVEPAGSPVLSGGRAGTHRIQGIGAGFVPPVLNRELLDEVIAVSDDDAIQTAWTCAKRVGLLAGISCGAALWAALEVAARAESKGKRIVAVMPDSGERYVSQAFFAP
jgi:cysteine synthase A